MTYSQTVNAIPTSTVTQNTFVTKNSHTFNSTTQINVAEGAWRGLKSITIGDGANVRLNGDFEVDKINSGTNVAFDFQLDGTLVVNGSVSISNNSEGTIVLNGDLIINGGSLSFVNNTKIDLILNGNIVVLGGNVVFGNRNTTSIIGRGMIITVPPEGTSGIVASNNSTLNIGRPGVGTTQLSMITTGKADMENNGTFYGSLLLYGKDVTFLNNCDVTANTASVVSPGNIEFANNCDVTLRRGAFEDWEGHPDLEGEGFGEYHVVSWKEGNN